MDAIIKKELLSQLAGGIIFYST
ncbi:uncharacterized protein METZ01_LOCUS284619 [marine metagenome]|uniref:Uncharacterized protein n=1 Tax=marine metagenome TaxID=408172 RepID=A0A382L7H3_9ZZZZ